MRVCVVHRESKMPSLLSLFLSVGFYDGNKVIVNCMYGVIIKIVKRLNIIDSSLLGNDVYAQRRQNEV